MVDVADTAIATESKTEPEVKLNFTEQVNLVVKDLVQKEDGTWDLPDGEYTPELRYAAVSEKRRRDAQSALGKAQHTLKTTERENKALRKKIESRVNIDMSAEEKTELEELKFSDPDAWRGRMNELEIRAAADLQSELDDVSNEVTQESEVDRRATVLAEFNKENPDSPITDDVINNDIPPRITNKLKNGDISFEDWLGEVHAYMNKGKVIKDEKVATQPNLGKIGGSDTAEDSAVNKDIAASYVNEIF